MVNPGIPFFTLQEMGRLFKDGMIIYDLARKHIAYINEPASALTGLREESDLEDIESAFERIPPNDRKLLFERRAEFIKKEVSEIEFTVALDTGSVMVSCQIYRLTDALVLTLRDITRVRQHEDYLVKYAAKKNVLLDNLTHHISGALNLMRHLSTEAGKHLHGDSEVNAKTYLNLMEANCLHCIDIINDLMQHEHQESTGIVVKKTKVDVVQIARIVYQELVQSYSSRKITMHSVTPSIQVMTDNFKLIQVINNLVSNALKFSGPERHIHLSVDEHEAEVIVSVADQGIGIPDALKPSIFEKQPGGGRVGLNGERTNGIGLSICKNLMTLMGGRIWYDSEEGKGATFYISLPKR